MIRIVADVGAIFIDGIAAPMPCGTLQASLSGSTISIANIRGGAPLLVADFSQLADDTGAGFASAAAAMAHLGSALAPPQDRTVQGVAASDIAAGQPLAVSRSSGQLILARADTYASTFVAGLALAETAAGFVARAGRGPVTLADWTAVTGVPALLPGQPYFLAPGGGLTTEAINPGALCVARVGLAATATTLIAAPSDPILL